MIPFRQNTAFLRMFRIFVICNLMFLPLVSAECSLNAVSSKDAHYIDQINTEYNSTSNNAHLSVVLLRDSDTFFDYCCLQSGQITNAVKSGDETGNRTFKHYTTVINDITIRTIAKSLAMSYYLQTNPLSQSPQFIPLRI